MNQTNSFSNKSGMPQRSKVRRLVGLIVKSLAVLILLLLVFVSFKYYRWTRSPLPQIDGEVRLKGLKSNATIVRDHHGVPYITAANMEDLAYAQGYAIAQDRLWQMDLARRAAKGELSAVLGAGDNNFVLDTDKLHRSIGLRRAAERALTTLTPELKGLLESYARGVNAFIDEHRNSLPFEFNLLGYEPAYWQPIDTIAIGKLMALSLTNNWKFDLMRAELKSKLSPKAYEILFYEKTPYEQPIFANTNVETELPQTAKTQTIKTQRSVLNEAELPKIDAELFAAAHRESLSDYWLTTHDAMLGSNNWVISGSHTTTGKPLLCNDPHQGLSLPAIWYQVSVRVQDGSYQAAGVAIMGAPGIVIGHNNYIAWGATNFMADVQDLYIEEFDTNNAHRYRVGDEWKDAEVINETIEVRKSMTGSATDKINHEIVITRHGPIVATAQGQRLALKWSGVDTDAELASTLNINRARNWQEFTTALKDYAAPIINFVYADLEGNIGYYGAGRMPVRANGDGSLPYDGRKDDGQWLRYVPFEELPHIYNPPNGFIGTANQKITGDSYAYHLANDWAPSYRAFRIYQLLASQERFSLEDMHKLQADVYAIPTHLFAEAVVRMAGKHENDAKWQELGQALKGWNGNLDMDSKAATIAVTTRNEFSELFYNGWLGEQRATYEWYRRSGVIDRAIAEQPTDWLPQPYKSFDEMIIKAYDTALSKLQQQLGPDRNKWRYAEINKVTFAHPLAKINILKYLLNPASVSAPGSAHTINCIDTNASRMWGPSMRMVVSLADFDATTMSLVPGESAQMASPYYSDQINDWLVLRPQPFPFKEDSITKQAVHKLQLVPAQ